MVSYNDALSKEELRQSYLQQYKNMCSDSVLEIIYDSDYSKLINYAKNNGISLEVFNNLYFCVLFVPEKLGLGYKQPIFVFKYGFDKSDTEEYFLSCLIDHECIHSDDMKNGIVIKKDLVVNMTNVNLLQKTTVNHIAEYRACKNQFLKFGKFGRDKEVYFDLLYDIDPQNDFESRVIFHELYGF